MRAGVLAFFVMGCAPDGTLDLLKLDGSADAPGEACGACPCGTTMCSGTCVDLLHDPDNCNGCGKGCAHNQWCNRGACECLPGLTLCGTSCFDLAADPDHCGACTASICTSGQKCESSTCASGACTNGNMPCAVTDRTACVTTTVPFCNACGITCAPNQVCTPMGCKSYKPATPCTQCPCDCGSGTCCTWLTGAICVEGTNCP